MANDKLSPKRIGLLADVAEMYYIEGLGQSDIALKVGVTRSMVSRMLTEARLQGIVEIRVVRPFRSDHELEEAIKRKFDIKFVCPTHHPLQARPAHLWLHGTTKCHLGCQSQDVHRQPWPWR